jgi:hypothetical protein
MIMNDLFLGFKYACIPISSSYEQKDIVQLGWKCRKYQNWQQVQDGTNKVELVSFGNAAVDQKRIDYNLLPVVNKVLFNVQKWRLDKENLLVDPPLRNSWEHAEIILKSSVENPKLALNYLHQHYELPDAYDFKSTHSYLSHHLIITIIGESCSVDVSNVRFDDLQLPLMSLLKLVFEGSNFPHEVKVLAELESFDDILMCLNLPCKSFDISNAVFDEWEPLRTNPIVYVDRPLDGSITGKITMVKGNKAITFNSNNLALRHSKKSEDLEELYRKMVESNLLALESLSLDDETVLEIHTMWGLKLNRIFR